jgi:choline-glycine betaine transporter
MGIASKGMIAAFVVFTALNVEFANSIYSAIRGWIESALNWYYISALVILPISISPKPCWPRWRNLSHITRLV